MDSSNSQQVPPPTATDAGISTLPSVYSTGMSASPVDTTTGSTTVGTDGSSGFVDTEFLQSVDGILKLVEMVFSLVTFICATVWHPFVPLGGGWVQFVAMTSFILTVFLYMLYLFRLTAKLSAMIPFKFTELCYYVICTLFFFIAGIVSAVNGYRNGAVVAAAVFSFFSMAAYGVDTYFRFMSWRHSSEGPYFSSTISNVMKSSSTDTAHAQY